MPGLAPVRVCRVGERTSGGGAHGERTRASTKPPRPTKASGTLASDCRSVKRWPASARAWGKAAMALGVAPCGRTVVAAMQVGGIGTMAWQALAHIAGVEPAGAPGRVGEESWHKKRVRHGGLLRWPTERRAAYWSDNGRPTSLRVSERRRHSPGHPDGLLRL